MKFVTNKFETLNESNPPWMTSNIKDKISYCDNIFKEFV